MVASILSGSAGQRLALGGLGVPQGLGVLDGQRLAGLAGALAADGPEVEDALVAPVAADVVGQLGGHLVADPLHAAGHAGVGPGLLAGRVHVGEGLDVLADGLDAALDDEDRALALVGAVGQHQLAVGRAAQREVGGHGRLAAGRLGLGLGDAGGDVDALVGGRLGVAVDLGDQAAHGGSQVAELQILVGGLADRVEPDGLGGIERGLGGVELELRRGDLFCGHADGWRDAVAGPDGEVLGGPGEEFLFAVGES